MRDVRDSELKYMTYLCIMLVNKFPKLFSLGKYVHPLLGERVTLIVKPYDNESIDIANLGSININFEDNILVLRSNSPQRIYTFSKFMEDETVM